MDGKGIHSHAVTTSKRPRAMLAEIAILNVINLVTNGMFGLGDGSGRQLDDGVF